MREYPAYIHCQMNLGIAGLWELELMDRAGVEIVVTFVTGEPVIKDYLNSLKLKENINVICAEIDREDFKSPNCIFRKAAWVKLEKVPTLFNPSLQRRLVERECMDKDKLDSFFSDVMKV
ncbi:uncharacterized protein [Halyomorpha halys]|uniref:uncharacterized protein isoform X2 n=1 Tax=Halyomorpha halys TaxID=286706 RepID=UPI0006D4C882|nr:uncharacterized protein LOC106677521 isoform X2 [Halyomorpha halys]